MFVKAQPVRRRFKVALSGIWKTGKTRAALSFPKPAVIDTHRGTDLYDEKYDFYVTHVSTYKETCSEIDWLRVNAVKEGIETLVIDDISTIYDDVIGVTAAWRSNKSGTNAPLNQGDWGIIKRTWKSFLQMLLRLDLNVVLVTREKDEYEETQNARGEEVRKKTGNVVMDVDRQTAYLFDFILHLYTEDNKKAKTSSHFVRIEGTRHHSLPKYSIHDITGKRMYDDLFEPMKADVEKGLRVTDEPAPEKPEEPIAQDLATEPGAPEDPPAKPPAKPVKATPLSKQEQESVNEIKEAFGIVKPSPDQPEASLEEIKVLMTRAGDMFWPDDAAKCRRQSCSLKGHNHVPFKSADAKNMIKGMYGVDSSKELRKPQIDFLYEEFGKVLSGRAFLDRDGQGSVYVATPIGVTEEEVKRNVLAYAK